MPRANRHFLPGLIWHLTHRCDERDFLLKFSQDRIGASRRCFGPVTRIAGRCLNTASVVGNARGKEQSAPTDFRGRRGCNRASASVGTPRLYG